MAEGLTKDGVRNEMCRACAIVYGKGSGMSLLELCAHVLEHGLPSAAEREKILASKHAEDEGDTTIFSSPGLLDQLDAPDATAAG